MTEYEQTLRALLNEFSNMRALAIMGQQVPEPHPGHHDAMAAWERYYTERADAITAALDELARLRAVVAETGRLHAEWIAASLDDGPITAHYPIKSEKRAAAEAHAKANDALAALSTYISDQRRKEASDVR